MIPVKGPWKKGFAFDVHTVKSVPMGENQWGHMTYANTRSEMGEQIYILKYRQDINALSEIMKLLSQSADFVEFVKGIDIVLPVPPSTKNRYLQPVITVAHKIAETFGKELRTDVLNSTNNEQVKNLDSSEKHDKVKNSIVVNDVLDKSKRILIFDDLFDSGSTLKAYVETLLEKGHTDVSIFTLTKTRIAD